MVDFCYYELWILPDYIGFVSKTSWSYFFIIPGFSSKHSNAYSSFYYQEYRLLEGTSLVAEGRVGGVFFFLNVRIAGVFFRKLYWLYGFLKKCTDFFLKNVRIVRIFFRKLYGLYGFFFENCTDCTDFSENVRIFVQIFSKKFWPPWSLLNLLIFYFARF